MAVSVGKTAIEIISAEALLAQEGCGRRPAGLVAGHFGRLVSSTTKVGCIDGRRRKMEPAAE